MFKSVCAAVVVAVVWHFGLSTSAIPAQELLLPPAPPGRILQPRDNELTAFEAIENANKDEANLRIVDSIRGELYQGDIQLTNEQRRILGLLPNRASCGGRQRRGAMASLSRRWVKSNGEAEIPYQIERSVKHAQSLIEAGIRHWMERVPCLKFVQRTRRHANYVSFFAGGGCYSMVGRIGGGQKISIGRGCEYIHTVVHEIGHALGFWHEQARPDRDRYITIYWNNIPQRYRSQFSKMSSGAINSRGVSYDYDSVMHYHSTAFGGGRTTIRRKDGSTKLGNTRGLSLKDIKQANLMYCNGLPTNKPATAKPPTGCRHRDYHQNCPVWANKGYCRQTYQIYMKKNCKASCFCQDNASCTDRKHCAFWVRRGFCTGIYQAFMFTNCKKSCRLC